jgi:hypothetical protein
MSRDKEPRVEIALAAWRMSHVERDWEAVQRASNRAVKRHAPRKVLLGVTATALVLIAAPALAVITGSARWPWSGRPGASLSASVNAPSGNAELRLHAHRALVYRTGIGSKPRFLTPATAHHTRRFTWELRTRGGNVASAAIVARGTTTQVCAPCGAQQSGALVLNAAAALDLLNGAATFRARVDGRMLSSPIHLRRLR